MQVSDVQFRLYDTIQAREVAARVESERLYDLGDEARPDGAGYSLPLPTIVLLGQRLERSFGRAGVFVTDRASGSRESLDAALARLRAGWGAPGTRWGATVLDGSAEAEVSR